MCLSPEGWIPGRGSWEGVGEEAPHWNSNGTFALASNKRARAQCAWPPTGRPGAHTLLSWIQGAAAWPVWVAGRMVYIPIRCRGETPRGQRCSS